MSETPILPTLFGDDDRLAKIEARLDALEARREVRTHAAVADREQKIVDLLDAQSHPLTIAVIAVLVGIDYSAAGTSCRKLEKDGRIARVEIPGAGRHPHYTAAR